MSGHNKETRGYQLVDVESGEVQAKDLDEAREKGLLEAEKPVPQSATKPGETKAPPEELLGEEAEEVETEEEELSEPPRGKEKPEKAEVKEISSEGIFHYTIALPADAFTLFNIAKAYGMEREDKLFDEFVWECITARFAKDYQKQLILAPIEEE